MLKIGLSFHAGKPAYDLYAAALLDAGARFGVPVEPVWLARSNAPAAGNLHGLAGVVFTGGADVEPARYGFGDPQNLCRSDAERDAVEFPMLDAAIGRRLPVLAICRGMQLLNVACGGTLVPDLPGHDPEDGSARHAATLEPGSFLARTAASAAGEVNSSHHQAVDRPGQGLRVVGTSADGIVEAIEWEEPEKKSWLVAVQWHPERMSLDEPLSGTIYEAFLRALAS